MALIELRKLARIYQTGDTEFAALRDVYLSIERGEFVAMSGSSGSGKSTLRNVLGCLDSPTRGGYFLADRDVANSEQPPQIRRFACAHAEQALGQVWPDPRQRADRDTHYGERADAAIGQSALRAHR